MNEWLTSETGSTCTLYNCTYCVLGPDLVNSEKSHR